MTIKNLAQLKREIANKHPFRIVKHYFHDRYTGTIRTPNVIQTNGFYSIISGEPDNAATLANYGKGVWCDYGTAKCYDFLENIIVFKKKDGTPYMEIEFI